MHISTNNCEVNLKNILANFGKKADCIKVASAFFSDTEGINDWLSKSKEIYLLISLRPPTNYYSLKAIHSKYGIHIQFLGEDFHSKFFIFYRQGNPFACVIGSSNFTAGGLYRNIETNAILTDSKYLTEIERHFVQLFDQSYLLQPTDLDDFKRVFDNFKSEHKKRQGNRTTFKERYLQKGQLEERKSKSAKRRSNILPFGELLTRLRKWLRPYRKMNILKFPFTLRLIIFGIG